MACPQCKSDQYAQAHRRGQWERLASGVGIFPHRCVKCGFRFSAFNYEALVEAHHIARLSRRRRRTPGPVRLVGIILAAIVLAYVFGFFNR